MPLFLLLFILFWLLLFGGAVGSFLNVVIYRLPAGVSLSYPPSHCPRCGHPIRPYDNLPVFGWILLRGKCRDCKAPISVRYPLVEGFCALMLAGIGLAVLSRSSVGELGQSLGLIAYWFMLATTLLAAGLIEFDGKKVPSKLFVPAILVVLIFSRNFPHVHPIPYSFPRSWFPQPGKWHQIWGGGFDAILGALPPLLAGTPLAHILFSPPNRCSVLVALTTVGFALGWQLAVGILAVLVLYCCAAFCFRMRKIPLLVLFAATLIVIIGMGILCHNGLLYY